MKRTVKGWMSAAAVALAANVGVAQNKIDEQRMERDIEIAENVLGTLIKQQFEKRAFFPLEVDGSYMAGYGVTLRIPYEMLGSAWAITPGPPGFELIGGTGFTFSFDSNMDETHEAIEELERSAPGRARADEQRAADEVIRAESKVRYKNGVPEAVAPPAVRYQGAQPKIARSKYNKDSARTAYTNKIIEASKSFLADYGDLIGQLSPTERIVITNRGEGNMNWYGDFGNNRPSYISVEATKGDVAQFRQGKMTRDQLLTKMKVINSVLEDELQPDLELLSSIINRLYRPDLSSTYFTQDNIYYERLKDYGVIYYLQVYSSQPGSYGTHSMPTLRLENVDQEARDKKVKELYPVFEKEVKENMLDYGRTLKSLGDEEQLIFNIKLTRCDECGIPSSLELSVKSSVLKDLNTGKLTKEAALPKILVKKGADQ